MTPGSGILLILSGPSGSGKTTLSRRVIEAERFVHSISVTTRAPRKGEVDGRDYHFLSPEEFARRAAESRFLEHAKVHGNHYGTLIAEVVERLEGGEDVVMDVDVQGARQIRSCPQPLVREALVDVFVAPPDRAELRRRLTERGTDDDDVVERRLSSALEETKAWSEYRYAIRSANREEDWRRLHVIIEAERLRSHRQGFDLG